MCCGRDSDNGGDELRRIRRIWRFAHGAQQPRQPWIATGDLHTGQRHCLSRSKQRVQSVAGDDPAGTTITFNNTSGTTHNVTFTTAGAPANVADFASGTRSVTFTTAGTYNYHCTIHGLSMSGVVVVQ